MSPLPHCPIGVFEMRVAEKGAFEMHVDEMPEAVDGRAVYEVGQEPVAVRRHGNQIDLFLFGDAHQLRRRIARGEARLHVEAAARQLGAELVQVGAIVFHLLRLAQLKIVEVARDHTVCDVDKEQQGARQGGQLFDVPENRAIGRRVLDRHEDFSIHGQPANV